jgi:hypothetical protein
MRYRGENLVENSVNKGCRGWDLEDIAGDSLKAEPTGGGRYLLATSALTPTFTPLSSHPSNTQAIVLALTSLSSTSAFLFQI